MKTVKRLISTVCFLLILILLFSGLTYVTRNKNESGPVYSFYDEKENSLDVLFVGSSHTMCSIYPMELYHEYGITSYDYTSSALVQPQIYYLVVEALKTQAPKVLVLDVSGVMYGDIKTGAPEYVHTQLDNMRWSRNKIEAINDLIETPGDRLEYYFPLLKFHTRWKELRPKDFERITSAAKGAHISDHVLEDPKLTELMPEDYVEPIAEYVEQYLRKTLDYCRERNVQVLLLNPPTLSNKAFQGRYNAVCAIAEEYGCSYLNLTYHWDEIGFDYTTDFGDILHCNRSGAEKVSSYVGNYLKEHYEIPDRRNDPAYAAVWNEAYEKYMSIFF